MGPVKRGKWKPDRLWATGLGGAVREGEGRGSGPVQPSQLSRNRFPPSARMMMASTMARSWS